MRTFICIFLLYFNAIASAQENASLIEIGRKIYETGILINGHPIEAKRNDSFSVTGSKAACALCHRFSGMGLAEGASLVPPITAKALFDKLELTTIGRQPQRAPGVNFIDWPFKTRPSYNDETLARAISQGTSSSGHAFQYLMPRYAVSDQDLQALIAYLHTLSSQSSPGISAKEVHFATVITPDVSPEKRAAFLQVMRAFFDDKALNEGPDSQRWHLHIWALTGLADTWQAQLNKFNVQQPVYSLISGLGDDEWQAIENFCEENHIPCLFPNINQPGSNQETHFNFYFSRGSQLEADVMAKYINDNAEQLEIKNIVILEQSSVTGLSLATAKKNNLDIPNIPVTMRTFTGDPKALIKDIQRDVNPSTALLLLLNKADLLALNEHWPIPGQTKLIMISGLLGGLENTPLNENWRKRLLMTYPYDPPVRWNHRKDFNLRPWAAAHKIEPFDERMQGNTLAACNLLYEGMLRLRGQYLREYLIENIENYPTQMGNAPAPEAYPRFSLGPGQRFSSKGAHIVKFGGKDLRQLIPEQEWVVP